MIPTSPLVRASDTKRLTRNRVMPEPLGDLALRQPFHEIEPSDTDAKLFTRLAHGAISSSPAVMPAEQPRNLRRKAEATQKLVGVTRDRPCARNSQPLAMARDGNASRRRSRSPACRPLAPARTPLTLSSTTRQSPGKPHASRRMEKQVGAGLPREPSSNCRCAATGCLRQPDDVERQMDPLQPGTRRDAALVAGVARGRYRRARFPSTALAQLRNSANNSCPHLAS